MFICLEQLVGMLVPEGRGYCYVTPKDMNVKWLLIENYFLGNKPVKDQKPGLLDKAIRNEVSFPYSLYNNIMFTKEPCKSLKIPS